MQEQTSSGAQAASKGKSRILSVDVGLVRIGLAISDELKIFATPLENFQAKATNSVETTVQEFIQHITRLGYVIETIVVGLPLKMNATDSKTTEHARRFADTLKQLGNWPVELFDERLTTVQAERSLKEGSFSRKKRAQLVDSVSAVILLQNYLQIRGLQRC